MSPSKNRPACAESAMKKASIAAGIRASAVRGLAASAAARLAALTLRFLSL